MCPEYSELTLYIKLHMSSKNISPLFSVAFFPLLKRRVFNSKSKFLTEFFVIYIF